MTSERQPSPMNAPLHLNVASLWVQSLPATEQAGLPSTADDHAITRLDLMEQLIKDPQDPSCFVCVGD